MQNPTKTREFFARVYPWPEGGEAPSYCNLHWTSNSYKGVAGRACHDLDEVTSTLKWLDTLPDVKDIYFCTSAQAEYDDVKTAPGARNKKARRSSAGAVRFKSLFLDLDAKGVADNSYASQSEAGDALMGFLAATHLPPPNAIVSSGNGLHVYWTLASAITREQWQPLANALAEATRKHGLKVDTQCTIDAARILRVPDTLNHKTIPPKSVSVVSKFRDAYSLQTIERLLLPYMVASSAPLTMASMPLTPRAPILNNELAAGIASKSVGPIGKIGMTAVLAGCGFLAEALATGGAANANPLWHQSVLAAAFMENGNKFAHAFSRGHHSYTPNEVDQEYARVERDIAQRGLGWPSCRAIQGAGCTHCATCPAFSRGKSPLNLALVTPVVTPKATAAAIAAVAKSDNSDMPKGYKRRADGVILKTITDEDGASFDIPITEGPIYGPWLQSEPRGVHFKTIENGREVQIFLANIDIPSNTWRTSLAGQGFLVQNSDATKVNTFMVSWLQQLQNSRDAVSATAPFGWEHESADVSSAVKGFAFGERMWKVDGTNEPFIGATPALRKYYRARGDYDIWKNAAKKLITDQRRPSLEIMLAASFASPLVKFTGHKGLLISAFSSASGVGKTTAINIAQAVWGAPDKTQTTLDGTDNSFFKKMGDLRSLPLLWDENQGADPKKFVTTIFRVMQGTEKTRLNSALQQVEPGVWQTMVLTAQNDMIADLVNSVVVNTEAGLLRLFEYEIETQHPDVPKMGSTEATRMTDLVNVNHGWAGTEYVKYLSTNYQMIYDEVGTYAAALEKELSTKQDERFWVAMIAAVLLGAKYANAIGATDFHIPEMKAFLLVNLARQRKELKASTINLNDPANVSDTLQRFLTEMQRNTLITNKINMTPGKPTLGDIQLVRPADTKDGMYVQIGVQNKMLRISSGEFNRWMAKQHLSKSVFLTALDRHFGMTRINGHIGSGTTHSGARQYVYDINIIGPLESLLEGF